MTFKPGWGLRAAFVLLLAMTVGLAVATFHNVLSAWGMTLGEWALLGLYTGLTSWIAASFWISVVGAGYLMMSGQRRKLDLEHPSPGAGSARHARAAVVMPLYNEDPYRALDGLRATYESLDSLGAAGLFHFFVLSDSQDREAIRSEADAWIGLCRELEAGDRIFYRRRRRNTGKKAGNIKEFCERWGRNYEYLIILDADSVMAGRTLLDMVGRMDREPELGLVQAWPVPVNGTTFFRRMQQFAAAAYGRLIAAGLAILMEPYATYWGHNAIVRVSAFMQCCGLPRLSGKEPLGGEILSHDFVEAALLARQGWRIRIMVDGDGSYEEGPPNLIEHAKRDRRWCQGNLQHARLLLVERFKLTSRMNFLIGVLSYCTSTLWLAFMIAAVAVTMEPAPLEKVSLMFWYAASQDVRVPVGAIWLIGLTVSLLLGPKLLGFALIACDSVQRRAFGGFGKLAASAVAEALFAAVIAPTMMLFHIEFVMTTLAGKVVRWNAQVRGGESVGLRPAARVLAPRCITGIALAITACALAPKLIWWMLPLIASFSFAIPIVVWSGRDEVGRTLQRIGLCRTPSETAPHPVLARLKELRARAPILKPRPSALAAELRRLEAV